MANVKLKKNYNDKQDISVKSSIEDKYVGDKCFRYNQIKKFFKEKYDFITSEIYIGTFSVLQKLYFPKKHIDH